MKWWWHVLCGVVFLWVVAMVAVFLWYAVVAVELDKQYYRQQPNLEEAERLEYLKTLRFQGIVHRVLAVLTPAVVFSLVCLGAGVMGVRACKQACVHHYTLGSHDIVVHERDLSQAAQAAFRLLGGEKTAEERKTADDGDE